MSLKKRVKIRQKRNLSREKRTVEVDTRKEKIANRIHSTFI